VESGYSIKPPAPVRQRETRCDADRRISDRAR
jgi:hypothetical protein